MPTGKDKKRVFISLKQETLDRMENISKASEFTKSRIVEMLVELYLDQLEKRLQDLKST